VVAWKALAAFAILVAGAVAAFAVYSFGREDHGDLQTKGTAATGSRIITLRRGDVVRVPAAATECEASEEGGHPNLFCVRKPQGRYQVVFFKDSVDVWGPGSVDKGPASYPWEPKRGRK